MSETKNKKIMAQNIKRYMLLKGVSKQQLCTDLGFKYTTFVDWYNGVTYPRIGKVEALANYFGCEKSDLIEEYIAEPIEGEDTNSKNKQMLVDFAQSVPEEKADLILRVMKSILEDGQ